MRERKQEGEYMEDHVLIDKVLKGDPLAIEQLHDRYLEPIFNYIYMQTNNYHDSEELLQDVFYKVASQLHTFAGKSSFKTWIFTITRHVIIDYYRKNDKRRKSIAMNQSTLDSLAGSEDSAEKTYLREFDVDEVMFTLEKLPDHYRTVLYLRFIEGFSIKETANIMGKTILSVKSLQHRARKALFDHIQPEVMGL